MHAGPWSSMVVCVNEVDAQMEIMPPPAGTPSALFMALLSFVLSSCYVSCSVGAH